MYVSRVTGRVDLRGGGDVDHRLLQQHPSSEKDERRRRRRRTREKNRTRTRLHFWRRHDHGTTVEVLARFNGSRAG